MTTTAPAISSTRSCKDQPTAIKARPTMTTHAPVSWKKKPLPPATNRWNIRSRLLAMKTSPAATRHKTEAGGAKAPPASVLGNHVSAAPVLEAPRAERTSAGLDGDAGDLCRHRRLRCLGGRGVLREAHHECGCQPGDQHRQE